MEEQQTRIHFMDSMRATLMMLGVVIHSAVIFDPREPWLISSSSKSELAMILAETFHSFRMESFFVVSGFFCLLSIRKYSVSAFLKIRVQRIIVPLVFTALTLNSLQVILLNYLGLYQFDLYDYLSKGEYISHLWFLTNIIVYFVAAILLTKYFSTWMDLLGKLIERVFSKVPFLLLIFIMPLVSLCIYALDKVGFPLYSSVGGIFKIDSIMMYSPYFIFGVALGIKREYIYQFCKINPFICLLFAAICTLLLLNMDWFNLVSNNSELLKTVISTYLTVLRSWFAVAICFYLFHRFFNFESQKSLFLSDAYSVYLFHHLIVVSFGLFIIQFNIPPLLAIPIIIIFTISLSLLIHRYFIKKNKLALFLFNGK